MATIKIDGGDTARQLAPVVQAAFSRGGAPLGHGAALHLPDECQLEFAKPAIVTIQLPILGTVPLKLLGLTVSPKGLTLRMTCDSLPRDLVPDPFIPFG